MILFVCFFLTFHHTRNFMLLEDSKTDSMVYWRWQCSCMTTWSQVFKQLQNTEISSSLHFSGNSIKYTSISGDNTSTWSNSVHLKSDPNLSLQYQIHNITPYAMYSDWLWHKNWKSELKFFPKARWFLWDALWAHWKQMDTWPVESSRQKHNCFVWLEVGNKRSAGQWIQHYLNQ